MDWSNCVDRISGIPTLSCIPVVINNIIGFVLSFSGIVAVIIIIYASFKYIRSRGDQTQIEEAKRTLTYGVVGLAIIFSAFFIVRLISTLTGVPIIANPVLP